MGSIETKTIETTTLNKKTSDNTSRLRVISSTLVTIFEFEDNLIENISLRLILFFEVTSKDTRERIKKLTCHCVQKIPSDRQFHIKIHIPLTIFF